MGNRELLDIVTHIVYEGITSIGVIIFQDGHIELKGRGITVFEGEIGLDVQEYMSSKFTEKGFEIEFSKNFKNHQWIKLFSNAVINPITAITRRKNSIILSKSLDNLVASIIEESVYVAGKEGFNFNKAEVMQSVYLLASRTSSNTSSMLQDIMKRRPTEIESINGYIINQARKHAIQVPLNETLYALLKTMESEILENPGLSQ